MTSAYIPQDLRQRVADQAQHRCGYCLTQEVIVGFKGGRKVRGEHDVPATMRGWLAAGSEWAVPSCAPSPGDT
jgi:hypothetical protein